MSTFTDVRSHSLPIKDVLTWRRLTVNFLRTTVLLTVNCLYKRQGKLTPNL